MEGKLIFISGGARSGKSSFAERHAISLAKLEKKALYYLATSKVTDGEMHERMKRHQHDRDGSDYPWRTIESSTNLWKVANKLQPNSIVLLDCLTVWLTNEMFRDGLMDDVWMDEIKQKELIDKMMKSVAAIFGHVDTLLIVSNEVLNENVYDRSLVQCYSKLLGELHQKLVEQADTAYLVEAGIPLLMKGEQLCVES